MKEEWFTDMDSLKEKIGLIETLPPPESASKPRGRSKRVRRCYSSTQHGIVCPAHETPVLAAAAARGVGTCV